MPKSQVTIPVFLPHRGCPHRCIFCNQRASSGCEAITSPEDARRKVEKYLDGIAPGMPRVEAAFFGGNFTGLPPAEQENYLSALGPFLKEGRIQGIRVSTRPDFIDMDIVERLARFGVDTVELGVQSLSDEVLSRAWREHSAEDVYRAVDILKASGMDIILQLMPGLPGDSRWLSVASAREAAALNPAGMRIFPAVVLRGTELERMYVSGDYVPLTLEEAVDICADMLSVFLENNIPVIRMGLHPLKDGFGDVVAGPYHPAFGFLVKARVRRREMESALRQAIGEATLSFRKVVIQIPRGNVEEYIGHGRENIQYLREIFHPVQITHSIGETTTLLIQREG